MGGVYGDIITSFPEQRRLVTVYEMTPGINGGWTIVPNMSIQISAIFQNTRKKSVVDSNGNLVYVSGQQLWTETSKLDGWFTNIDGNVYRITGQNNWDYEGGHYAYDLEKVVGGDGTESVNPAWNTGGNTLG